MVRDNVGMRCVLVADKVGQYGTDEGLYSAEIYLMHAGGETNSPRDDHDGDIMRFAPLEEVAEAGVEGDV